MSENAADQSWTVGRLMEWTTRFLSQKGVESPHLDARILLAKVLGCPPIDLYGLRFSETASEEVRTQYRKLIERRLEGCPVSHLVGKKEFFSLEFEVSEKVLTPRPESEMLVVEALALAKNIPTPEFLDLGTGSGNLAIAIAFHLPAARITAVDSSADALEIAQRNAEKHGVEDRIDFLLGDLFETVAKDARFDLIVSNPPYISEAEFKDLAVEVRDYEPYQALVGGEDGFEVFQRIIEHAPGFMHAGSYLLIEIGAAQEASARERIGAMQAYELHGTVHDRAGHPRVIKASLR